MRCVGNPNMAPQWQWRCGFYPGSEPGEGKSGTAPSFEAARAAFLAAWRVFLSNRTEADFQEWRDQRDWTARKYALWGAGERLPSQRPSSMMPCIRGKTFDSHWLEESLIHVPPSERSPDTPPRASWWRSPTRSRRCRTEGLHRACQCRIPQGRWHAGPVPRRRRTRHCIGLALAA
jgi:hypothetical protein